MAYRIIYGPEKNIDKPSLSTIGIQIAAVIGMTFSLCLIHLLIPRWSVVLESWLSCGTGSVGEAALKTLAASIVSGEEWYHAAVVYCAGLLEGTR